MVRSTPWWLVLTVGCGLGALAVLALMPRHESGRRLSAPVLYRDRVFINGKVFDRLLRADVLGAPPREVGVFPFDQRNGLDFIAVSPDGREVAFQSDGVEVNVVSLADGATRRIAPSPQAGFCVKSTWTPSGKFLACRVMNPGSHYRGPTEISLALYRADSLEKMSTLGPAPDMDDVHFFPDGRSLIFSSAEGIETMRTDGTGRRILVPRPHGGKGRAELAKPTLSPDGKRLAYLEVRSGGAEGLHLLDLKTKLGKHLGGGLGGTPRWSPEGRHIAMASTWDRSHAAQVVIVDVQSGRRQTLTRGARYLYPVSWSPTGSEILALTFDPTFSGRSDDLFVVDVASGEEHLLSNGTNNVEDAAWIPAPGK